MADSEFKSKARRVVRGFIDFVFGIENKRGDILDHWISFHPDFSYSPQEFYSEIEKELASRKVPEMEISREEFCEGGLLSDKRIYLRFFRERLGIYTCASPFGTGYFFSCRVVHVPALVRLWHILAALSALGFFGVLMVKPLGIMFAAIALITLLFALAAVFRNAAVAAASDVDTFLLKIPVIATIYEDWFRVNTYYREDTRAIYLQAIPNLVRELAEEITAAKGVKLVEQYRYAPILGELYKPVSPGP